MLMSTWKRTQRRKRMQMDVWRNHYTKCKQNVKIYSCSNTVYWVIRDLATPFTKPSCQMYIYIKKKKKDLVNNLKNFTMLEKSKALMFTQYQLVSAKHYDIMWKTHDLCKNNNKKGPRMNNQLTLCVSHSKWCWMTRLKLKIELNIYRQYD